MGLGDGRTRGRWVMGAGVDNQEEGRHARAGTEITGYVSIQK